MRMLVLDDNAHRHTSFNDYYVNPHFIYHAYTPEEAITALEMGKETGVGFDMIWLDHDMANAPYSSPSDEQSGFEVAKWLEENTWYQDRFKPVVVCHTMNHRGGVNMADALLKGGYTPILWPFTCLKGVY
jgi:hypothetical protein